VSVSIRPHRVEVLPPELCQWEASATGIPYVHERVSSAPGPEVLLAALAHGNEYSGAIALDEFLRSGLKPRRGRITAMFCNMAAFTRFDAGEPDNSRYVDEDFNRVWHPSRLDGSGDSSELRRARELRPLVERATHLLDLHSMHEPCTPLLLTGLLPRNIAFAQALGTHAQVVVDAGHADGVRMRDHGAFGDENGARIALLLEAGQHWDKNCLAAARNTLMRFLLAAGSIEKADVPAGWLQPDTAPPAPVHVTHRVVARSMDFAFVEEFHGGECIARAGTVIAYDADNAVRTPYDDCVLVMPSVRQLRPGVTTVRLGRPMASRKAAAR
jgi:predicted deacylase